MLASCDLLAQIVEFAGFGHLLFGSLMSAFMVHSICLSSRTLDFKS